MKITIYKYIISEIWPTFLASLFVSVFIIMATKILSITELILTKGVRVAQVIGMVVYLLPDIITFALPAASLIAVVVAFLRLSSDSEIIALESSGVSLYQMLPPVLSLSFLGFLIAVSISVIAVPWGNRSFKSLIFQIAQSKADLGIQEHIFCEPFDKVVFYVNHFSGRERTMKDVFVVDRRDKSVTNTIVAKEGIIFLRPEDKIITLHFLKGTIFVVDKDLQSARTIGFNTYDLNIGLKDIMAALASRRKAPKEMSVQELIRQSERLSRNTMKHNIVMIELLEKFSIPVAVFFMGIIGVPLGSQMRSRGKSTGVGVSLFLFLTYYVFLAGMKSICETGFLSPSVGIWLPDLFLLFCCAYLLRLSARERSLRLLARVLVFQDFIGSRMGILKHQWKKRTAFTPLQKSLSPPLEWEQLCLPLKFKAGDQLNSEPDHARYSGSTRTHKFHRLDCMWAAKIAPDNIYSFKSKEDAMRQGYVPCKMCNP